MKRWLPIVAAIALIALFLRLGFWQLGRAEEKAAMFADFDQRAGSAPVLVSDGDALSDVPRYQAVRLEGRFDAAHTLYRDNQTRDGRPGVHVMTPFVLAEGAVLVNRGWVAMPSRSELPAIETPEGPLTLSGAVAPPPRVGLRLGSAELPDGPWPKLVTYLDVEQVAAASGQNLAPQVLLLSPASPGGYVREWRPRVMTPERHRGYAVQWFALAAAVAVVWLVVRWRLR